MLYIMASEKMYYNLEYLNEISGGDEEFINDMVVTFVNTTPQTLDEIKTLVQQKKWSDVYSVVHRFAPSLQFLGASEMENLVDEIENNARNQENTDKIHVSFIMVEEFCNKVIENLKKDFNL